MIWIEELNGMLITKCRLRLLEGNPVFPSISLLLCLIPFESHVMFCTLYVSGLSSSRQYTYRPSLWLLRKDGQRSKRVLSSQVANLLFRMRVFSDQGEVEQRVGEVLVGHGGVGKHTGAGMAFADGAGTFLVGFQM